MTIWDFLNSILDFFPPIAAGTLLFVAGGVLIHGFNRHGINFIKYGLKQTSIDESLEKRFDELGKSFENRIDDLGESFENRIDDLGKSFENRINDLGKSFENRSDELRNSLENRINDLATTQTAQFNELKSDQTAQFDELKSDITRIETNHFGHLKNYLGILNGVLLDKQIIDNETKARLDNELRGM